MQLLKDLVVQQMVHSLKNLIIELLKHLVVHLLKHLIVYFMEQMVHLLRDIIIQLLTIMWCYIMGHYDAVAADSCGSSAGDFYVPLASRYYTAFGGCHGALKGSLIFIRVNNRHDFGDNNYWYHLADDITNKEILSNNNNTVQHWANTFINSLQISYQKCPQNAPIVPSPCNSYSIQRSFKYCTNDNNSQRVIILGLGGTLIPSIHTNSAINLNEYTSMKKINQKTKDAINKLSPHCTIAILSSLPRKSLEILLCDINCLQYAENGYFMGNYNINSNNKQWQITTNYTDNSWKDEALKIMKYFKKRTPNTTLDDLTSFVSFRYNINASGSGYKSLAGLYIVNGEHNKIIDAEYNINKSPIGYIIDREINKIIDGEYNVNISPIGDTTNQEYTELISEEYYKNDSPIGDVINDSIPVVYVLIDGSSSDQSLSGFYGSAAGFHSLPKTINSPGSTGDHEIGGFGSYGTGGCYETEGYGTGAGGDGTL